LKHSEYNIKPKQKTKNKKQKQTKKTKTKNKNQERSVFVCGLNIDRLTDIVEIA